MDTAKRHILVALDPGDSASRAVLYVGDFLGGVPGFRVTLMSVIGQSPTGSEDSEAVMRNLDRHKELLVQAGFAPDDVNVLLERVGVEPLSERIGQVQERLGACTVVMGRRGISKKEEFIFGSTSSELLHRKKHCALWIVE